MAAAGLDDDYDLAYEHFDLPGFLLQAPQFLSMDRDPLAHFLSRGAEALAAPEVNFDMGAYLARRPEPSSGTGRSPYVEWLSEGRPGAIADPAPGFEVLAPVLGLSHDQLATELGRLRSDLQERLRTGRLGEMIARAAEVEPLVADIWPATLRPTIPPFRSERTAGLVAAVHAAQEAAGFARARVLLVCGVPRWGGGRRLEGHLTHAFAGEVDPEDIAVVYTDAGGRASPGRFPDGVREIDLTACVGDLPPELVERVLVELIRSFQADVVINISSMLLYRAMTTYGRALAASERIFLVMFGNEQLALGNWVGHPLRFFYRSFDVVAGVIVDSHHLADWLVERHQITDEMRRRIHVFSAPVDPTVPVAPVPPSDPARRPQVFWAGRFDRQKRIDLVFEIARRMPDVDFRMWGEAVLTAPGLGAPPDNVRLQGTYRRLGDIELGEADGWLYTSAWDGVPSQLLEVAMTGIPIVGTRVGGTAEVLVDGLSWPVDAVDDPAAYVAALREVVDGPDEARRRARELRELLVGGRGESAYAEQAVRVLLGSPGSTTGGTA
jgi:glycosyltransferase involved in cell wall biosynthesis